MMTPSELAIKRRGLPARICDRKIILEAATGTMDQVSQRVWDRGELTNGTKLKYNEDYEVWAYKPPAPSAVSGRGKPNAEGKSKKIKGGYYETYLAFKRQQGGRDKTPFDLTSELRQSYLGGATPTPTEINGCEVQVDLSTEAAKKWEGLTESKGEFLKLNAAERKEHHQRVLDGYRDLLNE
jgi:hypothetical protein